MRKRCIYPGIICAAASIIVLSFACSMKSLPIKNYFILSYRPNVTVPASSQRPYPYALQVGDFEVQPIFNRQNILYRFSPHQIQYYELEQWAVRPDNMISNLVFKHLEASSLTNRVGIEFFDTRPDYRIEGMVEAIEKYDAGDIFYAHLAMSLKMLRTEDGEQVWEHSFDERKQVYQPEMVFTVQSLSSIFQSQMDVVVAQLDSLFLSIDSGKLPVKKSEEPIPKETAQKDSTENQIDESGFEIIPEKTQRREKQ